MLLRQVGMLLQALTSDDNLIWKGTIEFKGGEFKFRCNDDWDVNLGGDMQNLTPGGANIASPGEGTYEVTLNLSQAPLQLHIGEEIITDK